MVNFITELSTEVFRPTEKEYVICTYLEGLEEFAMWRPEEGHFRQGIIPSMKEHIDITEWLNTFLRPPTQAH